MEDTDVGVVKRCCKFIQSLALVVGGDKEKCRWFASENALERGPELLESIVDGGNNHGDILVSKGRFAGNGLGLVGPVADTVNKQANIAMKPRDRISTKECLPL